MPRFDIVYSREPTSKALHTESIVARDRTAAALKAMQGFLNAQQTYGARCYRILDGLGMVITRGPKEPTC